MSHAAPTLTTRDLLTVADLRPAEFANMLHLAAKYRHDPFKHRKLLRGETVLLHFAKPSTRTRFAFQTATARLGGQVIVTGPGDLQLGRGETIGDTARVASRMVAAVGLRTFDHADVEEFAEAAAVPVINMLSDTHHPSQALADMMTLYGRFGDLAGLQIAYVGDGNNVCHSLMEACALTRVQLTVATPPGYEPDAGITARTAAVATEWGGRIRVVNDPFEAVAGADAVYTDVWVSMGNDPTTADDRRAALTPYRITERLMGAAAKHAAFLHCLPAHRGDEVEAAVIDGLNSLVFDQAENRLHAAQAILSALIRPDKDDDDDD